MLRLGVMCFRSLNVAAAAVAAALLSAAATPLVFAVVAFADIMAVAAAATALASGRLMSVAVVGDDRDTDSCSAQRRIALNDRRSVASSSHDLLPIPSSSCGRLRLAGETAGADCGDGSRATCPAPPRPAPSAPSASRNQLRSGMFGFPGPDPRSGRTDGVPGQPECGEDDPGVLGGDGDRPLANVAAPAAGDSRRSDEDDCPSSDRPEALGVSSAKSAGQGGAAAAG